MRLKNYNFLCSVLIMCLFIFNFCSGKYNLLDMSNYEKMILEKSELSNYTPEYLTNQMINALEILDSAELIISEFAVICPEDSLYRFLQYEFFLTKSFEKAYGNWGRDEYNLVLSKYDSLFNILEEREKLIEDLEYVENRNYYIMLIDSIINISNSIILQNNDLWSITFTRSGYTLLNVYSQNARSKLNIAGNFVESSIMTIIPAVFSKEDFLSDQKYIGIRKIDDYIHLYYPNYRGMFEITLIYSVESR